MRPFETHWQCNAYCRENIHALEALSIYKEKELFLASCRQDHLLTANYRVLDARRAEVTVDEWIARIPPEQWVSPHHPSRQYAWIIFLQKKEAPLCPTN